MSEKADQTLSGVPETLLIPLYNRAVESQRPDAIIKDEKAVELVTQMGLDFSRVKQVRMTRMLGVMRIIFAREFDRYARDFLARHPDAIVVHMDAGSIRASSASRSVTDGSNGTTWMSRMSLTCAENSSAVRRGVIICWAARYSRTPGWKR